MSATTGKVHPTEGLDRRRRRAHFRAWHRGLREADLLLGPFADAHIRGLDEDSVANFEALMEAPDPEVVAWITGRAPAPPAYDTELLAAIIRFHENHGKR